MAPLVEQLFYNAFPATFSLVVIFCLIFFVANFDSYFIIHSLCNIQSKFGIEEGDEASIARIVQSYLEGLYWVLTYYHKGCGSWTWFYPYLYAPLASDLVKLGDYSVSFQQGRPFTPLLQLLSVLPPQSGTF